MTNGSKTGAITPGLFLSHSSVDKPFVEKLARGLERVGVEVWFDKWAIKVGGYLSWQIEEGLSGQ